MRELAALIGWACVCIACFGRYGSRVLVVCFLAGAVAFRVQDAWRARGRR